MTTPLPIVRAARTSDIDALYMLAVAGGTGLTNLPPDRKTLSTKLEASERAMAGAEAREAGSALLLITEMAGEIVGTSCIFSRVGAEWPFYSYRLTRQAALSRTVDRNKAQMLLNLANDFDGETEIGGLFIHPDKRGAAIGGLTARARYLFLASHRSWFKERVIAELRGFQDANGRSPVWEGLGRHFYDMEFTDADRTGAMLGNQFIADLGPRYPIYISLLPADAQAALGHPHNDGRRAYDMLIAEGFRAGGYVDIFDGGPTLTADIDSVRTVARTTSATVAAIDDASIADIPATLASVGEGAAFRVAQAPVRADSDGTVTIGTALATALGVGPNDMIFYAAA